MEIDTSGAEDITLILLEKYKEDTRIYCKSVER